MQVFWIGEANSIHLGTNATERRDKNKQRNLRLIGVTKGSLVKLLRNKISANAFYNLAKIFKYRIG